MKKIKVVDLFSGAGGLTYGFTHKICGNKIIKNDKFTITFANEIDENTAKTFKTNFPEIRLLECDISKINESYLSKNDIDFTNIDLVIGGPPCQSFSTIGKRCYDERAKMYLEYRRILSIISPKIFIFENVVGLLSMKDDEGNKVIENIKKMFSSFKSSNKNIGYDLQIKVLDMKDFGIPQSRKRVFIVGIKKGLNVKWTFPKQTHGTLSNFKPYITLSDAISDLPPIEENNFEYLSHKNKYQILLRNNSKKIYDHDFNNHGEKISKVLSSIKEGEGKNDFNRMVMDGIIDKKYYLTSGYANTYARLWWNKPCTTITNNFNSPSSLRCIHPKENRALTTREAARIQSFPDDFIFLGPKTIKNKQIGNAVPPLFAMILANEITKIII